jgi:hypothetical protein
MSSKLEGGEQGGPQDADTIEALPIRPAGFNNHVQTIGSDVHEGPEDADVLPDLDREGSGDELDDHEQSINLQDSIEKQDHSEDVVEASADSAEENSSLLDDTPSIQGSLASPLQSDTASIRSPNARQSPPTAHRAFDRRFQSRLSSSPLASPRASSPAFPGLHSRQSSLASIGFPVASEADDSTAPWDVIRWTKLRKITGQVFSEVGKRNFGRPTCIAITDNIVIGTSKGLILVFDYNQSSKASIGFGTRAVECGAITSLAVSADHTTIAAGHAEGHVFTWEVSRPSRPFLHIPPIDLTLPEARKNDGHIAGTAVLHISFLGYRRTALVSADGKGMAFSHLASRGTGAVARRIKTTRILGRYPDVLTRGTPTRRPSAVLAFSALPLGNVEQGTDGLGLVAMMTPYLLVIVSTTPIAQTQHKAARPKEVAAHGAMSAALAWFPAIKLKSKDAAVSRTKLAYCWSNVLSILEVEEVPSEEETSTAKPPDLQFVVRSRWEAEESIVAVQWLSRSVLALLTITQQLLVLEDVTMHVTDSFDLLPKNTFHSDLYSQQLQSIVESLEEEDTSMHGVVADAFHMSFRAYKGRLFLLGFNDLTYGSLTNWADRLLALIEIGDFIGAINLATTYYGGYGEKATIGLPEDDVTRHSVVKEKLVEIISASLKYVFGRNRQAGNQRVEVEQLSNLAAACIAACISTQDVEFMFDEVYPWFEDNDQAKIFLDVLEPYILERKVLSLPPSAVKTLIDHFVISHTSTSLEEIICVLDTTTMDIDQVTSLCKKYNLYDAYIYVWNSALADYVSPLDELLNMVPGSMLTSTDDVDTVQAQQNAQKMFPYMSYILTSRVYPTGLSMDNELADQAKSQLYGFLFSGESSSSKPKAESKSSFENLTKILAFEAASFMSVMNEAFEDAYLNQPAIQYTNGSIISNGPSMGQKSSTISRQYIVRIMLEVMASQTFDAEDSIYLDMFIARNMPKYPQYLLLSGTTIQEILVRLCQFPSQDMAEDAELSVEYLYSVYHPTDVLSLVPLLRKAKFYRVLKSVFRQERQYSDLVETFFHDLDDQEEIFQVIYDCLRQGSPLTEVQREEVLDVIKKHAKDLVTIDVSRTALTVDQVAPDLHLEFLSAQDDDPSSQFCYLRSLLEPENPIQHRVRPSSRLTEKYVQLMCQYNPSHVADYVESLASGDLRLEEVLPIMEQHGTIDAAVVVLVRQGQVKAAMERLTEHFRALRIASSGLVQNASEHSSASETDEAAAALLTSINKYASVGIWLCQGQTKTAMKSASLVTSAKRAAGSKPQMSFEEGLWVELIDAVVAIAQEATVSAIRDPDQTSYLTSGMRKVTQDVFTALLTTTVSVRDGPVDRNNFSFLRILRAFLAHAAEASPSLAELRAVIDSIFSAYAYEESLRTLANSMLDKDLFVQVDEVAKSRQKGWRPRGQVCEVCRRRLWGPGIGGSIWKAWQNKEQARVSKRQLPVADDHDLGGADSRGKGKAAVDASQSLDEALDDATVDGVDLSPVIVFSCRHIAHQQCLVVAPGPDVLLQGGAFACPVCV